MCAMPTLSINTHYRHPPRPNEKSSTHKEAVMTGLFSEVKLYPSTSSARLNWLETKRGNYKKAVKSVLTHNQAQQRGASTDDHAKHGHSVHDQTV